MSFKNELDIDKDSLDYELVRIASDSQEYGELEADKRKEVDTIKLELAVLEAQLDEKIRSFSLKERKDDNGNVIKPVKLTETQVKNKVVLDSKRIKKVKELNEAVKELGYLKAANESFNKKSSAVNKLCNLWENSYFKKNSIECVCNNEKLQEIKKGAVKQTLKEVFKKNN